MINTMPFFKVTINMKVLLLVFGTNLLLGTFGTFFF